MTALARLSIAVFAVAALASLSACGEKIPPLVETAQAPDSFRVTFETSRGNIVVAVHRDWAPRGVDQFYALVQNHFFDENRFFRVLPNYIAQFGVSGSRKLNERWDKRRIEDDPPKQSNLRGTLAYAMDGKNSRAHQLFFNLKDNPRLDKDGFVPIGMIVEGQAFADSIYDEYGNSPEAHMISTMGNAYLQRMFPKLDFIRTVR
jgi:peptidyl-prolyl cis-trans isomerase A (cyclophilin A)